MRPRSAYEFRAQSSSELLYCFFPITAAHPAMRAAAMEPGEIAMHSVIHSLHSLFELLLNSPHHLWAYAVAVAALLVGIPLTRALFRRRRKSAEAPSSNAALPSMLGLSSPPPPISTAPSIGSRSTVREFAAPTVSKVTAINQSLTAPCIHCGVTMSSRQDFCPACGYAQPVKQSLKTAFPA